MVKFTRPMKIMAKVAEQWWWKQYSQTMSTLWHREFHVPARADGERPLVFTEAVFHWVNGTKTGYLVARLESEAWCLVPSSPSAAPAHQDNVMPRNVMPVMVTTQTHGCSPGGDYHASKPHEVQRERGLDEGSTCGFFLHLFPVLMPFMLCSWAGA